MKKMNEISAYEKERIKHINYLMDTIHEQTSDIYEGLVDRDFVQLEEALKSLSKIVDNIFKSTQDEI